MHGPYYPTADESAQFLGNAHVDPNPPHVTYVLDGAMQEPKWGLTANHAYWLSGLVVRDSSVNNDLGTVDAFSHGFGLADPVVNPEQATSRHQRLVRLHRTASAPGSSRNGSRPAGNSTST